MTEKEEYEMLQRYFKLLQKNTKEMGKVPMTDEEVEKAVLSAMEKHRHIINLDRQGKQP